MFLLLFFFFVVFFLFCFFVVVFCDVSKAFDMVWHKGLTCKLKQVGIEGELLQWINDYLSDRKQKVVIRSCSSSLKRVNAGVPQGSVLGLLFFLVYVNDISESLLRLTRLYADDSFLFYFTFHNKSVIPELAHNIRNLISEENSSQLTQGYNWS